MINKKDKIVLLAWGLSTMVTLIFHYFLISKINVNSTIQVLIDFLLLWIIIILYILIKKINKDKKKKKTGAKWLFVYLMVIPVLLIHYFLISKINVNSTIQVLIDFIIWWIELVILSFIHEAPTKNKKHRNT
jgi:hypothetical protein